MAYSDKINHPKVKRYRFLRRFLPIIITVLSTALLAVCIGIRWGLTEPRPISAVIAAAIILFFIVLTITCINLIVSKKHVHY